MSQTLDMGHGGFAATATLCLHCGNPLPSTRQDGFCCAGCRAVNRLIQDAGLGRYYDLKPVRLAPLLGYFDARPSLDWIETEAGLADGHLELDIEGIQCGACVWAIDRLGARSGAKVGVNSALGRLSLRFEPGKFDPRAFVDTLFDFGYRVRRRGEGNADPTRPLLLRLGVCAAIAMNTMSFTLPFYFGLKSDGSGISLALRWLNFSLSLVSVTYGGGYFFKRAWAALRNGVAHFDIPVAIGVATVFLGSTWAQFKGAEGALYFDTLNVFLTLMLLGRYLQERVLLKNRRSLLKGDAFSAARVTDISGVPRELAYAGIEVGMRLLIQPGALCPVEAELLAGEAAEFDLASITGELKPLALKGGQTVMAGARLISTRAARVLAKGAFESSLLASFIPGEAGDEELPVVWRWSVRYYVYFVLTVALGGLAFWLWKDPSRAGRVFVSTLVVTCPCGLGIAVPLARSGAMRRLLAMGVTLRMPAVLDRLHGIEQVWLDKTGTLTFTQLELADAANLDALDLAAKAALMGAAGSSRHPVSQALTRELSARGQAYPENGSAEEIPGDGVRWTDAAGVWFLGRSMESGARAALSLDGREVARFDLVERKLEDAREAVAALRGLGLEVGLLSGDSPERVQAMAAQLGIESGEARSLQSPQQKAAASSSAPSLMLGDGLNDGQALAAARVSGTPAWERTPVADQADFSFSSASLAWLPRLFVTARRLRRVLWLNLAFAWTYNLVMVSLTLSALITPLVCAIVMPLSALLVITLSSRSMAAEGL